MKVYSILDEEQKILLEETLLKNEKRISVLRILLCILLLMSVILVIKTSRDNNISMGNILDLISLSIGITYSMFTIHLLAHKKYRKTIAFFSSNFDVLLVTMAIFNSTKTFYASPASVAINIHSFIYFLIIILTILRHDFYNSAYTGIIAALSYFGIVYFVMMPSGVFDYPFSLLRSENGLIIDCAISVEAIKSLLMVFAGFAAGYISNKFEDYFKQSFEKEHEKNRIKEMFGKYVSKELLEKTMDSGYLKSEKKKVTVLFADIRNFTNISENFDPETIVKMLNIYFEHMLEVIAKNKGFVDKFIGDAIMVEFGAVSEIKNQADISIITAKEMIKKLDEINRDLAQQKIPIKLDIGIGIHIGEVVLGNIGGKNRMEYTAIGDTVNIASRVEKLTKEYSTSILITEAVKNEMENTEDIGEEIKKRVQGKSEVLSIYPVIF